MDKKDVVRMRWKEENKEYFREVKRNDLTCLLRQELENNLKTFKKCEDFHFEAYCENWTQEAESKTIIVQKIVNLIEAVELSEDILFYAEDNLKIFKLDYWFADGSKFQIELPKSCLWIFLQEVPKEKVEIPKNIRFLWRFKGENYSKQMDRQYVLEIFKGFIYDYPENNTISKQLTHYIPIAEKLYVNWESTEPVKCLYLGTISGECKGLAIIYHHKIVWEKLAELYGVLK